MKPAARVRFSHELSGRASLVRLTRPQLPPPPCGEVRLGRRPSGVGVAGHRALKSMPATPCLSRRAKAGRSVRPRPLRLTRVELVIGCRALCPATPLRLGLRPSPPPPQGGRGNRGAIDIVGALGRRAAPP